MHACNCWVLDTTRAFCVPNRIRLDRCPSSHLPSFDAPGHTAPDPSHAKICSQTLRHAPQQALQICCGRGLSKSSESLLCCCTLRNDRPVPAAASISREEQGMRGILYCLYSLHSTAVLDDPMLQRCVKMTMLKPIGYYDIGGEQLLQSKQHTAHHISTHP